MEVEKIARLQKTLLDVCENEIETPVGYCPYFQKYVLKVSFRKQFKLATLLSHFPSTLTFIYISSPVGTTIPHTLGFCYITFLQKIVSGMQSALRINELDLLEYKLKHCFAFAMFFDFLCVCLHYLITTVRARNGLSYTPILAQPEILFQISNRALGQIFWKNLSLIPLSQN